MRVVRAIRGGMKKSHAARAFGVSRTSIDTWLQKVELGNINSLRSQKRGRKPRCRLAGHEAATAVRLITDRCPDQLKLPFVLWTRAAVRELLADRVDVAVPVWTVGRYLKRWGFSPQKPLRQAYERDPVAVKRWLEETYPTIAKRAKRENAEIHWGDEMGMRSDDQAGRSYGRTGQTPVVEKTGKRFSCNMISTITNQGRLAFMVFKERFTAQVMIAFLRRLVKHSDRKVFLILDGHPVHRSRKVTHWLQDHAAEIELHFLPSYSPELNPDEYLNNDVKANAVGRQRPRTQREMMATVRSYLHSRQRRPDVVKRYFKAKPITYAAA